MGAAQSPAYVPLGELPPAPSRISILPKRVRDLIDIYLAFRTISLMVYNGVIYVCVRYKPVGATRPRFWLQMRHDLVPRGIPILPHRSHDFIAMHDEESPLYCYVEGDTLFWLSRSGYRFTSNIIGPITWHGLKGGIRDRGRCGECFVINRDIMGKDGGRHGRLHDGCVSAYMYRQQIYVLYASGEIRNVLAPDSNSPTTRSSYVWPAVVWKDGSESC